MKTNDQLEPTVFVIFGGAGDLTWRKLVPALFDLSQDRSMPAAFAVIAGVEHRGGYYDHAGALRGMVQNHLMQLLSLVAMEPMVSFEADEIRNKKVDVLHAVRPIHPDAVHQCVVRGQYGQGWVRGKKVPGYREEDGVSLNSQTETFVALRLFLDNWRWQDVPFYLRTGKRLARQASEIAIQFRGVPYQSFPPEATLDWQPSRLVMSIHPDEGIVLRFQTKHPGPKMHLRKTRKLRSNTTSSRCLFTPMPQPMTRPILLTSPLPAK